jgi:hypothetical protein
MTLYETLTELPVLSLGWDADLRLASEGLRVWRSRLTLADGADFEHPIDIETMTADRGRWVPLVTIDGDLDDWQDALTVAGLRYELAHDVASLIETLTEEA